jgi:2,4-diketo-3-deoxy-L-fuconate hydrolase
MKLIRFGERNNEKPGILNDENERLDLSFFFKDWTGDFFANSGLDELRRILSSGNEFPKVPETARWAACVSRPYKVICAGLNYTDHAHESGMAIPEEPIIFMKASNTVVGPYDNVFIPRNSTKTDWEVELGVIISKEASYINTVEQARDHIAGFCVSHDVSERAFQLERGGQWTKGKSCRSFNPLGPFMVTIDELPAFNQLAMELKVNGITMQQGNTSKMIFSVEHIVWYLSQFMVLEPGDLVNTGTPFGVGMGKKPAQYLKNGDVVELSIEGLGHQQQTFIQS